MTDTSLHLHSTTFRSHDNSSHRTMHHERVTVHWSVLHSLQLKTDDSHESGQPSSARALLNGLSHGGYGGIRVGEAENPGPATHDRRINEAGVSVPSSLRSTCSTSGSASPDRNSRRPLRPKPQLKEYLRCAQCGRDDAVHKASTNGALMQHMGTRRTATAPRKRWATAPSRPCSARCMWHYQITTLQPMRLLQKQYRTSCRGYLSGQTTART